MLESGEGLLLLFWLLAGGLPQAETFLWFQRRCCYRGTAAKALPSQLGKGRKNRTFQSFRTRQKEERERKGWEGRKEEKGLSILLEFSVFVQIEGKSPFFLFSFLQQLCFFVIVTFFRCEVQEYGEKIRQSFATAAAGIAFPNRHSLCGSFFLLFPTYLSNRIGSCSLPVLFTLCPFLSVLISV